MFSGLFFGNPKQLGIQIAAVLMTIIHSVIVTAVILLVMKRTIGLALPQEEQHEGVDEAEHGEKSYHRGSSSIQLEQLPKKEPVSSENVVSSVTVTTNTAHTE